MTIDNQTDTDQSNDSADIKRMRKLADEAPGLKAENAQLKRQLAFVQAGIPLDDPKTSYFVKGYDGEIEPDAIKQAAIDAGFLAAPAPDPALQQAAQQQQAVTDAGVGGAILTDRNAILEGMRRAQAEGGTDAMVAYAQQYGLRVASS